MELRTLKQNRALHKYIQELSNEMIAHGYDLKDVLKEEFHIPATPDVIKSVIVKPLIKAMFGVDSTTKLTTKQINELYEVMNENFGRKVGISVPFPNEEEMRDM